MTDRPDRDGHAAPRCKRRAWEDDCDICGNVGIGLCRRDSFSSSPAVPPEPIPKDILYTILSNHIPSEMIDSIWQELSEALEPKP